MGLTAPTAAARIRRQVKEAEAKSDEALIAKAALLQSMLLARREVDHSQPSLGQDAIIRLNKAMTAHITAQVALLRTHDALRNVSVEVLGPSHEESVGDRTGLLAELDAPVDVAA